MENISSSDFIILGVLLFLSMFFSASETALTALNKLRLRKMVEDKVKNADIIQKLMENQSKMLTTILIGNNLVNISASSFATSIAIKCSNGNNTIVMAVTVFLTVMIIIFGEVIPKTIATHNAEKISLFAAPIIYGCKYLFMPLAVIINFVSKYFLKLFGFKFVERQLITEDELKNIVNVSTEEGVLEVDEHQMIHRVFDFGDITAEQVMIPRIDMITVPLTVSFDELMETFDEHKLSRLPIYNEDIDDIVGIIYLKDIIFIESKNVVFDIENYMREIVFTYESKEIDKLFTQMRETRSSMAIVLDEYGGTAGLLTVQDIVEEIFGDIHDEDDDDEEIDLIKVNDTTFLVDGMVKLDDLSDEIDRVLLSDDFESIGGYVVGLFGEIPEEKAEIIDNDSHILFVVDKLDKNRIERLKLEVLPIPNDDDTNND